MLLIGRIEHRSARTPAITDRGKGGLGEKRFSVATDEVLLFPTVAHRHSERVRLVGVTQFRGLGAQSD
ncbi:DUF1802 family protein [Mycobacterium canetti]|uniref:DUF1802 family protein n=1 Tax=Mycobacterium canetti TaxID=78331 RepID=UPI00059B4858